MVYSMQKDYHNTKKIAENKLMFPYEMNVEKRIDLRAVKNFIDNMPKDPAVVKLKKDNYRENRKFIAKIMYQHYKGHRVSLARDNYYRVKKVELNFEKLADNPKFKKGSAEYFDALNKGLDHWAMRNEDTDFKSEQAVRRKSLLNMKRPS